MRYERKYRIEDSNFDRILHAIMSNPAGFTTAFPPRVVNSIYYDDINFSSYNDNLSGISDRTKYRVRWYGSTVNANTNYTIEKKIKKNLLGTKTFSPIDKFEIEKQLPSINNHLPNITNQLFPHICISYHRTYLESSDGLIRATIDQNLTYTNIINRKLTSQILSEDALILEIKYGAGDEAIANECLQYIPYRMTKNSKYVSGMQFYLM